MNDDIDHIELKINEVGKGSLVLNGHPLKSVLGIEIRSDAGDLTEVTIRLVASVDADALVHVNKNQIINYEVSKQEASIIP